MKNHYSSLLVILVVVLSASFVIAESWEKQINKPSRFKVLGAFNDEAVLDRETRLVWEQSPDTTQRDWSDSQFHCMNLVKGNRRGWRLPTIQELASLVDGTQPDPTLPASHPFSNVQSSFYWSATSSSEFPIIAWSMSFAGLGVGGGNKVVLAFVWCVRGGQGVDAQ
jgi:Protein of unknown function (DUF1566)